MNDNFWPGDILEKLDKSPDKPKPVKKKPTSKYVLKELEKQEQEKIKEAEWGNVKIVIRKFYMQDLYIILFDRPAPYDIRYTINGSDVNGHHKKYMEPVVLKPGDILKARAYTSQMPIEPRSKQFTFEIGTKYQKGY